MNNRQQSTTHRSPTLSQSAKEKKAEGKKNAVLAAY